MEAACPQAPWTRWDLVPAGQRSPGLQVHPAPAHTPALAGAAESPFHPHSSACPTQTHPGTELRKCKKKKKNHNVSSYLLRETDRLLSSPHANKNKKQSIWTLMSQLTTLCPVSLPSYIWLGDKSRQIWFLNACKTQITQQRLLKHCKPQCSAAGFFY